MNDLLKGKEKDMCLQFQERNKILLSPSYFILEVTGRGEKCYIAYYFLKTLLVQKSPHLQENFSSTQHSPLLLRASLQHT